MVPGRKRGEPTLLRPEAEQAVAFAPRPFLDRGHGLLSPIGGEDRVRHPKLSTNARDHLGLGSAFVAKRVVDRRRLDPSGHRGRGKQQQCHAVRAAGDRDTDPRIGRDQRIEIGTEAVEKP